VRQRVSSKSFTALRIKQWLCKLLWLSQASSVGASSRQLSQRRRPQPLGNLRCLSRHCHSITFILSGILQGVSRQLESRKILRSKASAVSATHSSTRNDLTKTIAPNTLVQFQNPF
jgi:hypothetical protein